MKPRSESARSGSESVSSEAESKRSETTEDELIDWLIRRTSRSGGRWIGDDAAMLPDGAWAVTMDSQIEGTHFVPGLDPAVVARRLLSVNLSDLAAMGAVPAFAFLALAAPAGFDHRRFLAALTEACDEVALELAGGDLSSHTKLTAVLTLLGRKPEQGRWLRRGDARAGESLWLGGTVGEAAVGLALVRRGVELDGPAVRLPAGLRLPGSTRPSARRAVRRWLAPTPQLELGRWLGGRPAGAAIDVSDGLARDLHRLCAASGVGAAIDLDRLPLAGGHRRLARALGHGWRRLALAGGEDYVLLFTLPGEIEPPKRFGCTRVGVISDSHVSLIENGKAKPLPAAGWDHFQSGDGNAL